MVLIIDLNYLLHRCLYESILVHVIFCTQRANDCVTNKTVRSDDDKTKKKLATDILTLDGKVKKLIAAANLYFKNTQLQNKPPGM